MKLNLLFLTLLIVISAHAQNVNNDSVKNSVAVSQENFADDWAALSHYVKENQALSPPKGEDRVVFLGSSIFEKVEECGSCLF